MKKTAGFVFTCSISIFSEELRFVENIVFYVKEITALIFSLEDAAVLIKVSL